MVRALLLAAAAVAVPAGGAPAPAVQVCIVTVPGDPCTTGRVPVEGEIRAWGVRGPATVRWWVDGTAVQEVRTNIDGVSRHLLLLGQDNRDHRVVLEAEVGGVAGFAAWVGGTGLDPCPFDLRVDEVVIEYGRQLTAVIANRGPAASGWTTVRWLVGGVPAMETSLASLPPGSSMAIVLPWEAGSFAGGRMPIELVVEVTRGDMDPSDNVYDAVIPSLRTDAPARREPVTVPAPSVSPS